MQLNLEPSCFEPYTTNNLTGRATWYTQVEPRQVRRRKNQAIIFRVSHEGGSPGDFLCLDMPTVPDHIIFDIMSGLTEINYNLGHENKMEFEQAAIQVISQQLQNRVRIRTMYQILTFWLFFYC